MNYLVIASLIWAFSYGLIKANLTGLDANFVTFCRMACALPLFLPFLRLSRLSWKRGAQLVAIGAVQYGVMYACFIRAFQYLDAHLVALFTMMTPLYVVIIHDVLQKKFVAKHILLALGAVCGGVVIYHQSVSTTEVLKGFIFVQLADICFALGQVSYKQLRTQMTKVKDKEIYALLFLGALVFSACATSVTGGWASAQLLTAKTMLVLAYLGSISSGLCFFWWNKGAVTTKTGTLAIMNNLKAPIAILVSLLFFNESVQLLSFALGLGLILVCLYCSEKSSF